MSDAPPLGFLLVSLADEVGADLRRAELAHPRLARLKPLVRRMGFGGIRVMYHSNTRYVLRRETQRETLSTVFGSLCLKTASSCRPLHPQTLPWLLILRLPYCGWTKTHFHSRNPWFLIRFPYNYQQTFWFQPWFQSGAGFCPSTT